MNNDQKENWLLKAFKYDDNTSKIFRIMQSIPSDIDVTEFDNCVIIEWLYQGDMPDENTNNGFNLFEDLMTALDDASKNSLLVHSITGSGMKEWCYYAKDYEVFIEALNDALSEYPSFPINIEFQENTDWNYWQSILELSQEET